MERLHAEILGATIQLARGASVTYLRSSREQGCGSFPGCSDIRYVEQVKGTTMWSRARNWFKYYCKDAPMRKGRVEDCLKGTPNSEAGHRALFRCFTSEDANWSLNAAMVHRKRSMRKKIGIVAGKARSLAALGRVQWDRQDGFEDSMMQNDWGKWKVPICISYHGLFTHSEVDG